MNSLHSRLAKLLRLTTSSNAHEAANAASILNRLCEENGVDASCIDINGDEPLPVAMHYRYGDVFARMDYAEAVLLDGVCYYYGGSLVVTRCGKRRSYFKIFCTEGKKIRIEVYYEYLREVMDKLADQAKRDNPGSRNSFRQNFRKAFADQVNTRLRGVDLSEAGRDRQAVQDLMDRECRKLTKSNSKMGAGAAAGRQAANAVGLDEQVPGTQVPALPGAV